MPTAILHSVVCRFLGNKKYLNAKPYFYCFEDRRLQNMKITDDLYYFTIYRLNFTEAHFVQ